MMRRSRFSLRLVVFLTSLSLLFLLSVSLVASQTQNTYYPVGYSLLGNTSHVSGSLDDLQLDGSSYIVFQSYASRYSAQTLYAHQETTMINSIGYSTFAMEEVDDYGTDLVASTNSTGRQL